VGGDLGLHGRILKWILKKLVGREWSVLIWLRIGTNAVITFRFHKMLEIS